MRDPIQGIRMPHGQPSAFDDNFFRCFLPLFFSKECPKKSILNVALNVIPRQFLKSPGEVDWQVAGLTGLSPCQSDWSLGDRTHRDSALPDSHEGEIGSPEEGALHLWASPLPATGKINTPDGLTANRITATTVTRAHAPTAST